jgi:hypothetical protein
LINKIENFNIIRLDIDEKKIFYDDVKQEDINFKNLKYLRKEDF